MSNSIYTYRLSYLTFRDPSRARRGPLQVLEEKIRAARTERQWLDLKWNSSTCQLPYLTVNRLYNCHALLHEAGFPEGFFERVGIGTMVHRCQVCLRLPALGPYRHRGRGVRWNIHDSWELSLNASWIERLRLKIIRTCLFRAGRIECFQFRDLSPILKGVFKRCKDIFVFVPRVFLFQFYRAIYN